MTVLGDLWDEYKALKMKGTPRNEKMYELEKLIHEEQRRIKTPPFDFDKAWAKIEAAATPTVTGPPSPDAKPEPAPEPKLDTKTLEWAKSIIKENETSLLVDLAEKNIARGIIIRDFIEKRFIHLARNEAGKGQIVNQTIDDLKRSKEE